MSSGAEVFARLRRSPWKQAWDDFILSGDDDGNHHVLVRHGWTVNEFIDYGIENNYIAKEKDE